MKVACIMMQKDEYFLLEPWILYHGQIFGFENLYIFDNGSSKKRCLRLLSEYSVLGVNVIMEYSSKEDFESKGIIFSNLIKELDTEDKYDFYFPLDCDEFVAVENKNEVDIGAVYILEELEKYSKVTSPLLISAGYDNNPVYSEHYFRSPNQRKTFFRKHTCESLDMGFHEGTSRSNEEPTKTNIVYIHQHYKKFRQYIESARQKLKGRVKNFSRQSLIEYSNNKLPGYHLIGTLISGEDDYYYGLYRKYNSHSDDHYKIPSYSRIIKNLGANYHLDGLFEAFDNKTPRWKGYIESIYLDRSLLEIKGWFASFYRNELHRIVLDVKGKKYISKNIQRFPRQDVVTNIPFASEKAGFSVVFDIEDGISDIEIEDISIYNDEDGSIRRFFVSPNSLKKSQEDS